MATHLFMQSAIVALGATGFAFLLGCPVALLLHVSAGKARTALGVGSVATLALPAFLVAGAWMEWVGFAGAWKEGSGVWAERALPLIYSCLVLGFLLWPVAALWLAGAWDRLDARLLEAMPEMRGWAYVRHALLPVARTVWVPAAAIIMVLAFANFTVPALFQARVWPAVVWIEYATRFDGWAAVGKSGIPVLVMVGLIALGLRGSPPWTDRTRPTSSAMARLRLGRLSVWALWGFTGLVLAMALVLPLSATLFNPRTWQEFVPASSASLPTALRSIGYAGGAATLACLLGLLFSRSRWGLAAIIPFALPGVVVGVVLAQATTLPGLRLWQGTAIPVFVALSLRYVFVGWLAGERLWASADPRLLEGLKLDGVGHWRTWLHAVWPRSGRSLATAWLIIYLLSLWDVETLILVVPPGGDTLSLTIFNLLHYGHNAQVGALCLLLGGAAILPFLALAGVRLWHVRSAESWRRGARVASMAWLGLMASGCHPEPDARSRQLDSALFERVEVIGGKGTGPGFFGKPRSVAVDGSDNLYVVDMTGRVQKFSPEGRWLLLWQMPETDKGKAKGMCTAPDGALLVVEPHYHRVNHFSPEGRLLAQWGRHGTNAGELWFPRAVAVTRAGDCFVSEYGVVERIQRFRATDGAWLGTFGAAGTGRGQLNRAEGLGVDSQDRVYVANSCNHRIEVFEADGRWVRSHGGAGQGRGEFSYPYDVRVDNAGRQFVCEFGNSRVQVLDANDQCLEILGGPGDAPDRMNNPWGLCLDSQENLYVADSLNHRVLKFIRRRGAHAEGKSQPQWVAAGPGKRR
ncbi:MAG: hypothetical protein JNK85_20490 [Verrucomicrobiales bacterium]|nr:hypothetical protein [Verrucomicrobiales bacterium]